MKQMHSYPIDPDPFPFNRVSDVDFSDQPVIALVYEITHALMEVFGPMFWAALIVLFVQAELFTT